MTRISFVAFLTFLVLAIAGCDSNTSFADLEPGTFSLRIDGGEEVLQSSAINFTDTSGGIPYSGITLGLQPYEAPELRDNSLLSVGLEGQFEVGVYEVNDQFSGIYNGVNATYFGQPEGRSTIGTYFSRGGTLTISHSEVGGVVEGSFSITVEAAQNGEGTFEPSGDTLAITGSFSANYVEYYEG